MAVEAVGYDLVAAGEHFGAAVEADFGELIEPDVKSYGELKLDKDGNVV